MTVRIENTVERVELVMQVRTKRGKRWGPWQMARPLGHDEAGALVAMTRERERMARAYASGGPFLTELRLCRRHVTITTTPWEQVTEP